MPANPISAMPGKLKDVAGYLGSVGMQKYGAQSKLFNANDKGLDWITGPDGDPTSSPLYKSFLTKSRSSIGNSYDNAVMNSRANAASRGFGYASPNTAQAEVGLRGSEASEMGAAPTRALQATMPYDMQALGIRADEGKTLGAEGTELLGMYNQDETKRYETSVANKRALYKSLATIAGTALGGPIGGMLASKIAGGGGQGDGGYSGANGGGG